MSKNLLIFCVTDKVLPFSLNFSYKFAGVGKNTFPGDYLLSNTLDNIYYKEKYYSELTFHYWFWKNELKNINKNTWIGFCQKRRFWKNFFFIDSNIDFSNLKNSIITEVPEQWTGYNSVICEPIYVNEINKIKILKRGFKSLIKDPQILFNISKQTVKLHFDMHHGHGNLEKAIALLNDNDREEFKIYVNDRICFNPHIMFIAKACIADKWFSSLFPWLFRCEKIFGFDNLKGYDTQRLYAYLAERYLSFWFKKYTKFVEWPVVTLPL
jgi:hypothetical protein